MNTSWADRIRWCEHTMSRQEIADHCGIAYSTLNDICTGRSKAPRGYAAVRLHELSERCKPEATA